MHCPFVMVNFASQKGKKVYQKLFSVFQQYLLLLALWAGNDCFAQNYLVHSEHFGLREGLPARMAYFITQDPEGFIWYSSQMGIHRFDGSRIKSYSNEFLGMPSRMPAVIASDFKGRIWYYLNNLPGIPGVLKVLDPGTGEILSPSEATGGLVKDSTLRKFLKQDKAGESLVFIFKDGTCALFDGELTPIASYDTSRVHWDEFCRIEDEIWTINEEYFGHLGFGNETELFELPEKLKFPNRIVSLHGIPTLEYPKGRKIELWQLVNGQWIQAEIPGTGAIEETRPIYSTSLFSVFIADQKLWIVDSAGNHLGQVSTPEGFKIKGTYSSMEDQQGNLWLATPTGLVKVTVSQNPFQIKFNGQSVYGLLKENNRLWVGSSWQAIYENLADGSLRKPWDNYTHKSFLRDPEGNIWIAVHQARFRKYFPEKDSLVDSRHALGFCPSVIFYNQTNAEIWIGTLDGLYRFVENQSDFSKSVVEPISVIKQGGIEGVRFFYENQEGIWTAGSFGLALFDPRTGELLKKVGIEEGMPVQDLNHFLEDGDGNFWLASVGGGLIFWDRKNGKFQSFTTENGLSNNTLYAVYADDFNNFWLPSDFGLMCMDRATKEVRVFRREHGIAHDEFNTHSHFRDSDGTLYLGGLGGITIFHPSQFAEKPGNHRPVLISNYKVLRSGEDEYENRTAEVLEKNKVILDPGDQILEMEVSILDFVDTRNNDVAYRLKGLEEKWNYPSENLISYMNLPYGKYQLELRSRGASGTWTEEITTVEIVVLRPFYLKAWFLLLCLGLLIVLILGIFRWRMKALRADRLRLAREVRARTATIVEQAEKLKSLDELKTKFFTNITHEIRTPLTLVIGPVNQLIHKENRPETLSELKGIRRNARNLLELINQLLDISKLENSQMKLEWVRGDLAAFSEELVAQFRSVASQKGLQLKFYSAPEPWEVFFDADKWHKILQNLVSNAVKFTPAGGSVEVELTREAEEGQKGIFLRVRDTGPGIPAAEQEKIFDRFYQADGSMTRSHGGTGIGLSLVRELVELQGGSISVESQPGQGTCFQVFLPGVSPEAFVEELPHPEVGITEALIIEPATEKNNPAQAAEARLELLLIEDNAELRRYISGCIDPELYHIMEAENGEEGIALAIERVPDLIISDVMMPRKNGFEVVQTLRNNQITSHIPIILLTAKASLESRLEGIARGADAYLTKPFSPQELELRIAKLIEMRQLLRERYRLPSTTEEVSARPEADAIFEQEDAFMRQLREFIGENLNSPELKVDLLARELGMSRTQFYRKLSGITDVGVSELIHSIRCEKALDLIRQTDQSLSEIAYEVGYSSPSHFSRTFRKQFGISPSEVSDRPGKELASFGQN